MPDNKIPKLEAYETREVPFWKQGPTVEEPYPTRGSNQLLKLQTTTTSTAAFKVRKITANISKGVSNPFFFRALQMTTTKIKLAKT